MRILITGNSCFKIANFREGLVRKLTAQGHEVVVLAPTDSSRVRLVEMGCRVIDLHMERNGVSPLAEILLIWRIFSVLRCEKPDFLFSYTIKNNIYAGLCCRLLNISFVPNVTGLGPAFNDTGILNRIILMLYRLAFSRAQWVFFQNPEDESIFLQSGLTASGRSQLLPGSGVDLMKFTAHSLPSTDQGIVFLFVSRLLWDKGLGLFADAARLMRERNPSLQFRILGPIDAASRSVVLHEQVKTWVDEGHVEYLGEVLDVRNAMAEAHCVVLPTWYREGTPRVLLEAAAMGRPAITTDTPGCRDTVIDGKTGYLCKAKSLESLIQALERFITISHQDRIIMAASARELAETKFDEANVIDAYFNVTGLK